MKVKERKTEAIIEKQQGKYYYSSPGSTPLIFNYEFTYSPTLHEKISYDVGPKGAPKNCVHVKTTREHSKGSYSRSYKNGDTFVIPNIGFSTEIELAHDFSVAPSLPEGDFVARAFNEMKPKFQAPFSVANFVLELRELGSLLPVAHGIVGRLKSTKALSEAHLNYSFGISPLINDIERLYSSLKLYEMRYRQFMKAANKPHTSYYKERMSRPTSEKKIIHDTNSSNSGEIQSVESRCIEYTRVACMKYSYSILGAPPPMGSLGLKLKYLGLRSGNTSSIVWNALPFSFLIDWVLKVGDYLKQFDTSAIDVQVNVTSFMVSTKTHFKTTFKGSGGTTARGNVSLSWSAGLVIDRKTYSRTLIPNMIGNPNVVDKLPVLDSMSGRELMLGISLVNVLRK